jgi:hypothetical protein
MKKTFADCEPFPAAWLGYSPKFKPKLCVRICMDCPDKAEADALALTEGLQMSHTICPQCYQKQQAARMGETL